ncbi:hypothetical protein [Nocardioides sp. WS12]|uniref:hypothetical protein n=1 Tax=Nocardioides sp. WS12 TaxID=2486272 RepID=UPI0015FA51D9|nr:hypothetical protein [Nocardioides sp. WS12]
MNEETQLRGLLQAAVPDDASSLDPQTVSTAARRARHRNRLVGLGAAAATVAVIGAAAVVSTQGPDADRAADDTETTAPYDAPACPATLPELADASQTTGTLDGLTSVRFCPDLDGGMAQPLSTTDQSRVLGGMDALVEDLDGFLADLADLPAPDPARCAAISVLNTRQSLMFTMGNRTTLVPTTFCGTIAVEGHEVDGGDLLNAFLGALDKQRDDLAYHRDYTGPLGCEQAPAASPVKPGREGLVAAVRCSPTGEATPLTAAQLAALDTAWQDPSEVEGESCLASEPSSFLVVATDHGDVIRLVDSVCGVLTWDGWAPGMNATLPTTLGALGLG